MSSFDFTPEQVSEIFFSHLKYYGFPQQYVVGTPIQIKGELMQELRLNEWLYVTFPIVKEENQELDYPQISLGLGDLLPKMEFGETISWLIFGNYERLDNHDDTLENMKIESGVDWLKIKVKPKTIPNRSNFKILFTLKKTKRLMKAIENDKFEFLPIFSGESRRTY